MSLKVEADGLKELLQYMDFTIEEFQETLEFMKNQNHQHVSQPNIINLSDLGSLYLEGYSNNDQLVGSKKIRTNQLQCFKSHIERIHKKSSPEIPFHTIMYEDVQSFCYAPTKSGQTPKRNTYDSRLGFLKGLANYASKHGYAVPECIRKFKYKKDEKGDLPKHFTRDEVNQLLELALKTRLATRNFTIILFFVITGCRVSELCSIKYHQIDFSENVVNGVIRKGGGKPSRLFLTHSLAKVIHDYVEAMRPDLLTDNPSSQYLFCNLKKFHECTPLKPRNVEKMVDSLIDKLNIDDPSRGKLTLHSLRHTCAVLNLDNNMNIVVIQELLGHKKLTTTQIYTKIIDEHLKKKIEEHSVFADISLEQFLDNDNSNRLKSVNKKEKDVD